MLFDLQGKRRRMVQATYLILAILMGGGLVLFGVGSGDISGGLFDAITGKDSNSRGGGNSLVAKRIKADQRALTLNPQNTTALADLVRSHYQLATDDADQTTGQFGNDGKVELQKASTAWKRYVDASQKPEASLAGLMLNAYSEIGLNKPTEAAQAAQLVAAARPSAAAYLQVTRYASKAGQTRIADLAGQKAIDLAPTTQKKLVKQQVDAMKAGALSGGSSG
jgi:hypothetical protein